MNIINTKFLKIDFYQLTSVIYIFLLLLVLVFTFILVFSIYKRNLDSNKKLWQQSIAIILSQAIFFTNEEDEKVDINYRIEMLLQKSTFRDYLVNELIQAKKISPDHQQ